MRTAVLGHVEWIRFLRVPHMPRAGEIVHATEWYEMPAGGGATAAVQLLKLAGNSTLFTCLGNDELGGRVLEDLTQMGLTVHAARRDTETRSGITHVDSNGERTITVIGQRLAAGISDDLPWQEFEDIDCV